MKSRAIVISFAAFLMLCFAGFSKADAILSVSGPASVTKGTTFTLNVDISGVTDLYGFQFDLDFNPAVLQAESVAEGSFLPSGGSTFFFGGGIDNLLGSVPFNADTLLGAPSGVSGSGELVSFQFLALATGTGAITISNDLLTDSSLDLISDSVENGSVKVLKPSTKTPEPPTVVPVALLILLLAAFVQTRRTWQP